MPRSNHRGKLSLQGEFSYTPLYWEWLEDVFTCCKDLLVAHHMFDNLYGSLFVYDKYPYIVRVICECQCPETNSLHTSQGKISIHLLDIHGFLRLSFSEFLYEKLFHHLRNSRLAWEGVALTYLQLIIFFNDTLTTNLP